MHVGLFGHEAGTAMVQLSVSAPLAMQSTQVGFYRHSKFSNFWRCAVKVDHNMCCSSEQAFMLCKAELFGDDATATKILGAKTPKEAKALGRQVKNFDQVVWERHREEIMDKVLLIKFGENKALRELLVSHKDSEFVEVTPNDCIWGTGITMADFRAGKPWKGMNLLGKSLGRVRDHLVMEDKLLPL